jgi:gentisate 1,2-dioxygenase
MAVASTSRANSDYGRFMDEVKDMSLFPLWERVGGLKPGTKCVPAHWSYTNVRPQLMRAADLVTKKEASRRVLCLENPSLRGTTFVCDSLFAGLQIILPGEVAPSHRHTPSALRFIVEGTGAYTAVAGEKLPMQPGDFVVTPAWAWHDHGNLGEAPVVWLDGLDTPFARFFGAAFYEPYPQDTQPLDRPEGESTAVYGANLIPDEFTSDGFSTPVLIYPYERTREALDKLSSTGKPHPAHGYRLRYANPATGKHPFATMAVFMQRLPAGFAGQTYRSTGGSVFAVHRGKGTAQVGDETFALSTHDVFVVPAWAPYSFAAESDLELFSYSDRAGQEALGYWREQIG